MLLAVDEVERGWGGPVALLVFFVLAAAWWWVMETYGPASKIENPSPTEDWEEGEEVFYEVTGSEGEVDQGCGGGVVDHGSWRSGKDCTCGRCDMTPRKALP